MNTAEARNEFEMMIQQSLALRLNELGANQNLTVNALSEMDFEEVRKFYSATDVELKSAFAHLF